MIRSGNPEKCTRLALANRGEDVMATSTSKKGGVGMGWECGARLYRANGGQASDVSEVKQFLYEVGRRIGRSRSQVEPVVSTLVDGHWFDSFDALSRLTKEDIQRLNVPFRYGMAILDHIAAIIPTSSASTCSSAHPLYSAAAVRPAKISATNHHNFVTSTPPRRSQRVTFAAPPTPYRQVQAPPPVPALPPSQTPNQGQYQLVPCDQAAGSVTTNEEALKIMGTRWPQFFLFVKGSCANVSWAEELQLRSRLHQVTVNLLSGREEKFYTSPDMTVGELKKLIMASCGGDADCCLLRTDQEQVLFHDEAPLGAYRVRDRMVVHQLPSTKSLRCSCQLCSNCN